MKPLQYRKQKKLTQDQMARDLKITQPHYANIENGARMPSARLISRIEQLTGNKVQFRDFFKSVNPIQ